MFPGAVGTQPEGIRVVSIQTVRISRLHSGAGLGGIYNLGCVCWNCTPTRSPIRMPSPKGLSIVFYSYRQNPVLSTLGVDGFNWPCQSGGCIKGLFRSCKEQIEGSLRFSCFISFLLPAIPAKRQTAVPGFCTPVRPVFQVMINLSLPA